MRFFSVWCQRSILPCVIGWYGAPRTWAMLWRSIHFARSSEMYEVDDAFANIIRNAVPDAIRLRMSVVQSFRPTGLVQIVPTVEGGARNAGLFQRPPHRQRGLLDEPDDLKLLGGG